MISEYMFLGSSVAMVYFAYISLPKDDEPTLLNVAYGVLATWLAYDNSKLLLTDHINSFSGGVANALSSDVYSIHYLAFAVLAGVSTVYIAWEWLNNTWNSNDNEDDIDD